MPRMGNGHCGHCTSLREDSLLSSPSLQENSSRSFHRLINEFHSDLERQVDAVHEHHPTVLGPLLVVELQSQIISCCHIL